MTCASSRISEPRIWGIYGALWRFVSEMTRSLTSVRTSSRVGRSGAHGIARTCQCRFGNELHDVDLQHLGPRRARLLFQPSSVIYQRSDAVAGDPEPAIGRDRSTPITFGGTNGIAGRSIGILRPLSIRSPTWSSLPCSLWQPRSALALPLGIYGAIHLCAKASRPGSRRREWSRRLDGLAEGRLLLLHCATSLLRQSCFWMLERCAMPCSTVSNAV